MNSLRTILTATAVCAAMLAAAIQLADGPSRPAPHAGLTVADVLASDGTPPEDGAWSGARLDRRAPGRLASGASHPNGGARG